MHSICPGLINVNHDPKKSGGIDNESGSSVIVVIAHFSVQEYLESDRIRHQKAANYSLTGESIFGHLLNCSPLGTDYWSAQTAQGNR